MDTDKTKSWMNAMQQNCAGETDKRPKTAWCQSGERVSMMKSGNKCYYTRPPIELPSKASDHHVYYVLSNNNMAFT